MAQLWGGRFTKETDQLVYNFNASISFDQKFYKQDIEGSIAHVRMLGKQGILTQEEMQAIVSCLQEILADVESGKLGIHTPTVVLPVHVILLRNFGRLFIAFLLFKIRKQITDTKAICQFCSDLI